jgi:hypothetical protein
LIREENGRALRGRSSSCVARRVAPRTTAFARSNQEIDLAQLRFIHPLALFCFDKYIRILCFRVLSRFSSNDQGEPS